MIGMGKSIRHKWVKNLSDKHLCCFLPRKVYSRQDLKYSIMEKLIYSLHGHTAQEQMMRIIQDIIKR